MQKSIFRKSSLERISSPEQLNEYVKITNPGVWAVLLGLFALLIAVAVWAYAGSIPETVQFTGVVYAHEGEEEAVYCFVPMSVSKRLSDGMKVQVSPDYAPREEYGYISGTVESIGEKPVTEEEIVQTFGSIQYVQGLLTQVNMVEVRVALERAEGRLKWSTQKGESVSVTSGANCDLLIVTKERKPYELILK
jgi:multidrug efflux pump subunit AcrA (membrane-fusion protein)